MQMPQVNLEQGFSTLRTLHTRRGENQTFAWDKCASCNAQKEGQTWARLFGSNLEQQGRTRLGYDTSMWGLQIGHDFSIQSTPENAHRLTGVYLSYNHANTDFFDKFRAKNGVVIDDKFTGRGKSDSWNLGVTHTRYAPSGGYVDLVGQVGFLKNNYYPVNGLAAKNHGMSYVLSAEVGRPFDLTERKANEGNWLIEPQAQLVYQHLRLNKFNDGIRTVEQANNNALRGRAGVRLAYNLETEQLKTKTFYLTANILHNFAQPKAVRIGGDKVQEKYASTWWDAGVGLQLPIGQQAYVYLDGQYEGSFGSQNRRNGLRGSLSLKYNWK
ncbi:hypothetical protein BMT54_12120 [Pasteurellaceae bacterium 15-036681]|nr:hypothetical protein BMT54_12120 [Pasteurellaceae bacterium 15-036681]